MSDITLTPVGSGYNLSKFNTNFQAIEDKINDEILHLSGGNNLMQQSIDMNSNRILNLPEAINSTEPVRLKEFNEELGLLQPSTDPEAKNKVTALSDITALSSLNTAALVDGQQFYFKEFWSGTGVGGGIFVWDSTLSKTQHNGGTIRDPDKASELDGGSKTFGTWFTAAGSGQGCFVSVNENQQKVEVFGALGDFNGTTGVDSTEAIKAAIAAASSSGNAKRVTLGIGRFKVTESLAITSRAIIIDGVAGRTGQPTSVESYSTLDFGDAAEGTIAIDVDSGVIDGFEMNNLFIYRQAAETKGSGGIGLNLLGVHNFAITNVVSHNFDYDFVVGENATDRSAYGYFDGCIGWSSSTTHVNVLGVADVHFYSCFFRAVGTHDHILEVDDGPNGGSSDAVHFEKCFFISSTTQVSTVSILGGFWITFTECVFEGANSVGDGIVINKTTEEPDNLITAFFDSCWTNGYTNTALRSVDASVISENSRWHCGTTTSRVVILDAVNVGFNSKSRFSGGIIAADSTTQALMQVFKVDGLSVDGVAFDTDDNVSCMTLASNTSNCHISKNCNFATASTLAVSNSSSDNFVEFDGWEETPNLLLSQKQTFTTTTDGSGNVSLAHGIGSLPDRIIEFSGMYQAADGSAKPLTANFADGTNLDLSGGDPSVTAVIYVRYARDTF